MDWLNYRDFIAVDIHFCKVLRELSGNIVKENCVSRQYFEQSTKAEVITVDSVFVLRI